MEREERKLSDVMASYPNGQIFGIGTAGGWLWFGTLPDAVDYLAEFDRKHQADDGYVPLRKRRIMDVNQSVMGPAILIKIEGHEPSAYSCYAEWAEKERME